MKLQTKNKKNMINFIKGKKYCISFSHTGYVGCSSKEYLCVFEKYLDQDYLEENKSAEFIVLRNMKGRTVLYKIILTLKKGSYDVCISEYVSNAQKEMEKRAFKHLQDRIGLGELFTWQGFDNYDIKHTMIATELFATILLPLKKK